MKTTLNGKKFTLKILACVPTSSKLSFNFQLDVLVMSKALKTIPVFYMIQYSPPPLHIS